MLRIRMIAAAAFGLAAAALGLAPAQAHAQSKTEFYYCIVRDQARSTMYVTQVFQAREQPRERFYSSQMLAHVQNSYRTGDIPRGDHGCNGDDGKTLSDAQADRANWIGKEGFRTVELDWRPVESDHVDSEDVVIDPKGSIAALAIDSRSGQRYGWAIDYASRSEADDRALDECQRFGGACQVVLRFTGGCGAYAVEQGSDAIYGWGTNTSRAAAETRARSEVARRGGQNPVVRVWGCNSVRPTAAPTPAEAATAPQAGQPAPSPAEDAQLKQTAALNQKITAQNDAVQARNDAAKAAFDAAQAKYKAERAAYEAQAAAAAEAQAQYQRDQAAWAARVAACKAGDYSQCAAN